MRFTILLSRHAVFWLAAGCAFSAAVQAVPPVLASPLASELAGLSGTPASVVPDAAETSPVLAIGQVASLPGLRGVDGIEQVVAAGPGHAAALVLIAGLKSKGVVGESGDNVLRTLKLAQRSPIFRKKAPTLP
jgi:hypothetical protein